jgi:hypothetical protein
MATPPPNFSSSISMGPTLVVHDFQLVGVSLGIPNEFMLVDFRATLVDLPLFWLRFGA